MERVLIVGPRTLARGTFVRRLKGELTHATEHGVTTDVLVMTAELAAAAAETVRAVPPLSAQSMCGVVLVVFISAPLEAGHDQAWSLDGLVYEAAAIALCVSHSLPLRMLSAAAAKDRAVAHEVAKTALALGSLAPVARPTVEAEV